MKAAINYDDWKKIRTIKFNCRISQSNFIKHAVIKTYLDHCGSIQIDSIPTTYSTYLMTVYFKEKLAIAFDNLLRKAQVSDNMFIRYCVKETLDDLEATYGCIENIPKNYNFYTENDIMI